MKKNAKAPVWRLILTDAVLLGIGLLVFALFHHVLPQAYDVDPLSTKPYISHSDLTIDDGIVEIEPPYTEDIVKTERSYSSQNVAIDVKTYTEESLIYHVADIHVKNISSLCTAFAKDTYGRSISEEIPAMAQRNNAIVAINGDYYGASSSHVAIRNGACYKCFPKSDVCVIFSDGTMTTYAQNEFDAISVMEQGAWQAWSFGPSLLENGKAIDSFKSEIKNRHPRTVLGYYEPGHYCFIVVDGRKKSSIGLSLVDLSALCESLGLEEAYNLDGGQTSMMVFGDEIVNDPYKGGRRCSDIIYICEPDGEEAAQ